MSHCLFLKRFIRFGYVINNNSHNPYTTNKKPIKTFNEKFQFQVSAERKR